MAVDNVSQGTIVSDDFYPDPWSIRDSALACEYSQSGDGWPGFRSKELVDTAQGAYLKMFTLVSDLPPNWARIEESYRFWGEASCGGFQLLTREHPVDLNVHAHRLGEWTGLVYLSKPEACVGRAGTTLYEHRSTGSISCKDLSRPQYDQIAQDRNDLSKWTPRFECEMKFGRLLLFDSRQWHSWSPGFGETVEDGRLTQIFNFRVGV